MRCQTSSPAKASQTPNRVRDVPNAVANSCPTVLQTPKKAICDLPEHPASALQISRVVAREGNTESGLKTKGVSVSGEIR